MGALNGLFHCQRVPYRAERGVLVGAVVPFETDGTDIFSARQFARYASRHTPVWLRCSDS